MPELFAYVAQIPGAAAHALRGSDERAAGCVDKVEQKQD